MAQTGHDHQDEIYDAVPAEATAFMCNTLPDGQEILVHDAEVCFFAKDEISRSKGFRRFGPACRVLPQISPPEPMFPSPLTGCCVPCHAALRDMFPPASTRLVSEIPERSSDQACSAMAASDRVEAILDTGASRCVMGDRLLQRFLTQLPTSIHAQVRASPSAIKFRFGNNGVLTSTKRVYLPLQARSGKVLWMGIEVVPGQTPFLFSKKALKQLAGTVCTCSDTCWLGHLDVQLKLSTNMSGLYLIDVASLCSPVKSTAIHATPLSLDSTHVIQFRYLQSLSRVSHMWGHLWVSPLESEGDLGPR